MTACEHGPDFHRCGICTVPRSRLAAVEDELASMTALKETFRLLGDQLAEQVQLLRAEIAGGAHDSANYPPPAAPKTYEDGMREALRVVDRLARDYAAQWQSVAPEDRDTYCDDMYQRQRTLEEASEQIAALMPKSEEPEIVF